MIVSEARREANRRNAKRSTGPNSIEGKARVRANAIKHGMTAQTVDDAEAFRIRAADWRATLNPADPTQEWFADEIARITLKIDNLSKVERALRDKVASRAEVCWDGDRRAEVEALALKLSLRPSEVAIKLEQTVQGCEWMIDRWMLLADTAARLGEWDADQVRLAFDLMGTPLELRGPDPCIRLEADCQRVLMARHPALFARDEVVRLREIRDDLIELDDFDRQMTAADLSDASTPELRSFRRYETALHNRLKWCLKQFHVAKTVPVAAPKRAKSEPPVKSEPEPEPSQVEKERPRFHADPIMVDAPKSRLDHKLDRATSRREAKERKLERRRA